MNSREFFDAFEQMKKFVRQAKKDLVVIDPYFDDTAYRAEAPRRHSHGRTLDPSASLIHVGASLNHLGRRCLAFSTLAADFIPDIMARVP